MQDFISEEELENLRLKAKRRTYISYALSIISFPFYIYLFYISQYEKQNTFGLFIIQLIFVSFVLSLCTLGLLWYVIIKHPYNKFNENFKSKYVLQTINNIAGFENLQYNSKSGFDWDEIRNSAVIACGDKKYFESEDLLLGTYEGVNFKISDVTTKKLVYRDNKRKVEEIFEGQVLCFYKFDDTKISNGHLQIFKTEFLSNIIGWKAEHKIYTENESFNNRFKIYSDDEHNAYYILTPQLIQKIIEFSDAIGEQISLSFNDNKLFIAIKRESMFDALVDKPVYEQTKYIIQDAENIQKARDILINIRK